MSPPRGSGTRRGSFCATQARARAGSWCKRPSSSEVAGEAAVGGQGWGEGKSERVCGKAAFHSGSCRAERRGWEDVGRRAGAVRSRCPRELLPRAGQRSRVGMAPGGTFHAEGEGAGRTALPCPAEPACHTHCIQPCQMCGRAQALVEGRDPARQREGGHCLGHNEVCINEERQEQEHLNWTPASPAAPRPPAKRRVVPLSAASRRRSAGRDLQKTGSLLRPPEWGGWGRSLRSPPGRGRRSLGVLLACS